MRSRGSWPAGLAAALVLANAPAGAGERAYVLDAGAKLLVEVDLEKGDRVASVPLEGSPTWLENDGRYVLALDRGPGEDKGDRGFQGTSRSSVTIVDAATLKVVGRVELGFGIATAAFVAGGRLAVLCPGYEAKNPKESLPRELVVVDLATAREAGRLVLEPRTRWVALSEDRATLAVLETPPRSSKPPHPPVELRLVDLAGPRVAATAEVAAAAAFDSDGQRLYLLDSGAPDKDAKKNRNGTLQVVPFAAPRPERVDAGRAPVGWFVEGDALGLVSEGAPGGPGELRLVRAGRPPSTIPVAARPSLVSKANGSFYVVGAQAVSVVDASAGAVTATIPLAKGGQPIVDDDDDPTEMVVTADGRRAYIHYGPQHRVAVLDLVEKKALGAAKTGRGGKKFLNHMKAGLEFQLGIIEIRTYDFEHPEHLLARPDGRFAYAINTETKDVTVVDGETAEAVEKIGAEGRRLLMMGTTLVVVGDEIHRIDAGRNVEVDEIRLPRLLGIVRSPTSGVALAERTVLVLDAATGKERARLTDFVKPVYVEFKAEPAVVRP